MVDQKIITIGVLLTVTLIYSIFMSLMTWGKGNINFFPTAYNSALKNKKKSNYYYTLLSTTSFSYLLLFLIFFFAIEKLYSISKKLNITRSTYTIYLIFFVSSLISLLALDTSLGYFSVKDDYFDKGIKSLEYNYPFYATTVYLIIFLIVGSFSVNNLRNEYKNKLANLAI